MILETDHILASNVLADGVRAASLRAVDLGVVALATLIALALLNLIAPRFGMIDRPPRWRIDGKRGYQPSANRATRRITGSAIPPSQMGIGR